MGDLQAWFRTDADCLDYLEWLRWPAGFVCADCSHDSGWRLGDGRYRCSGCGGRIHSMPRRILDDKGAVAGELAGVVEVDETYIGGEEPGLAGGRARGKKAMTKGSSFV